MKPIVHMFACNYSDASVKIKQLLLKEDIHDDWYFLIIVILF